MTTSAPVPDATPLDALLAPGGPFELVPEEVLGSVVPVFARRRRALHELLAESVDHGDRVYLATAEHHTTFAEHARRVSALAAGLREEHGVAPGDRVAIHAANRPEWIETFWAVTSVGAIAVGFNAWWSAAETTAAVEQTTPVLVVADAKRAALVGPGTPVLAMEEGLPALLARHDGAPLPSSDVEEDDPAVILFTSGTSGHPKGVVHTHRNLLAVVEYHRFNDAVAAVFGDPTDPRDKTYLLTMPLFHVGSLHNLAVPRLATGSKVALHLGAFDVDRVLRLVESERVTNWGAVPTMAHRMLEHPDLSAYDTSSLRAFALASAPSSPAFKQRLRDGLPFASMLVDSYGLTETCTAVAVATPMDLAEAPGSLGRPVLGVQMEIRDPQGRPVPEGVEGEVCVRSMFVMKEYWDHPEATAAALREDRWLHTGDIGVMEQGRVRLSSRRADLIIRGGENINPGEIEAVLAEHPAVSDVVVLGLDDEALGQVPGAVVVLAEGADVTTEELAGHVGEQLAYYKVPVRWRLSHEPLPRNATGKVVRREVPLPDQVPAEPAAG